MAIDKLNSDKLNFTSNNVKGIQKSEKRNQIFEYLKNSISPKWISSKHMALLMTKKGGAMCLMAIYIFLMEERIRAV